MLISAAGALIGRHTHTHTQIKPWRVCLRSFFAVWPKGRETHISTFAHNCRPVLGLFFSFLTSPGSSESKSVWYSKPGIPYNSAIDRTEKKKSRESPFWPTWAREWNAIYLPTQRFDLWPPLTGECVFCLSDSETQKLMFTHLSEVLSNDLLILLDNLTSRR